MRRDYAPAQQEDQGVRSARAAEGPLPKRPSDRAVGRDSQWVPAAHGSVRLVAGTPVYLDGSADCPGTYFATASSAIVQILERGKIRAWQLPLDRAHPQSALSAEMLAVAKLAEIIARGFEEQQDGQVPIYIDCKAVILMLGQPLRHESEKFIFAGYWSQLGKVRHLVQSIHKVDAHKARCDAAAEGWERHWLGNDWADRLAKDARPAVDGDDRE